MKNEILIYAELNKEKRVREVVFELCSKSRKLVENSSEKWIVSVIFLGEEKFLNANIDELTKYGAEKIYHIETSSDYCINRDTELIKEAILKIKPKICFFGATIKGREIAPAIAAELKLGLTADCTELKLNENGKLEAIRPTFGGELFACIISKSTPQMATVRENIFEKNIYSSTCKEVEKLNLSIKKEQNIIEIIDIIKKPEDNYFSNARLILTGGRGLKTKENFLQLEKLATLLNAKVGATRAAVDMEIAPLKYQIGQTGKTVSPEIYVAFAVSGAAQHLVGISKTTKIIAINNDKEAPIFNVADYGIVANVFDIIPALINSLEKSG